MDLSKKSVEVTDVNTAPIHEPLVYDDEGQPVILRQVDRETGKMRTVVHNEDGMVRAFGEVTVASLVKSKEDEAKRWVDMLTDRELRGLVHEVGNRLLCNSRLYERHHAELEKLADMADYAYFGLPMGTSEKDLDNAYRQLAKRMHPDKNGGTQEAKQRFQHMKERYEALKARRTGTSNKEKQHDPEVAECDEEDHPATEEDERNDYDPKDRQSLHKTVWKMLKQLKTMQRGLEDLVVRLKKAGVQTPLYTT